MSENVTLISFYHVFLIWRRDRGYLKVQAIFRFFFVYLTSRASDTLKVQTDLSDVWQFNYNEQYP